MRDNSLKTVFICAGLTIIILIIVSADAVASGPTCLWHSINSSGNIDLVDLYDSEVVNTYSPVSSTAYITSTPPYIELSTVGAAKIEVESMDFVRHTHPFAILVNVGLFLDSDDTASLPSSIPILSTLVSSSGSASTRGFALFIDEDFRLNFLYVIDLRSGKLTRLRSTGVVLKSASYSAATIGVHGAGDGNPSSFSFSLNGAPFPATSHTPITYSYSDLLPAESVASVFGYSAASAACASSSGASTTRLRYIDSVACDYELQPDSEDLSCLFVSQGWDLDDSELVHVCDGGGPFLPSPPPTGTSTASSTPTPTPTSTRSASQSFISRGKP